MIDASTFEALRRKASQYVAPYESRYLKPYREFVERNWPGSTLRKDPAYLAWRYHGAPESIDNLLLLLANGRVVGQLGLIPARLQSGRTSCKCSWICALMVDEEYRGLGGWLIVSAIGMNRVLLGSDPSNVASLTLKRFGFKTLNGPRKMVLPIDVEHVLRWKLSRNVVNWAGPPLNCLNRLRLHALCRPSTAVTVRSVDWTDIADRIAMKARAFASSIAHDDRFLQWRLACNPNKNASTYALAAGRSGYAVCDATPTNFYVADWNAASADEAYALIGECYGLARNCGSKSVRALANTDMEKRWLKKLGFLAMRTPTTIVYYPQDALSNTDEPFYYQYYDSDENI